MNQSTVSERECEDDVGLRDTLSAQVDKTEDEGGEGESAQSQGSRVGELAALDWAIETRLELTTEGGETRGTVGDFCEGTIAKAGSSSCDLVLFAGHVGSESVAIAAGGIAGFDVGDGGDILLLVMQFVRHFCVGFLLVDLDPFFLSFFTAVRS